MLARTPFYAESGGQIADEGVIRADGVELAVRDVQKPVKGLIVHTVDVVRGELTDGSDVLAEVDGEWRLSACQAHSGTHIVHAALRQVLGPTALQSGSYNKPGYLRLDFAWTQGLSADLRAEIEDVANVAVRHDLPVSAQIMPLRRARELGALALFGETYDADVRVVEIGGAWSRELCGGTHVAPLVAGRGADDHRRVARSAPECGGSRRSSASTPCATWAVNVPWCPGLTDLLKVQPEQLPERVAELVARLRAAERQLEQQRGQSVLASAGRVAEGGRRHRRGGVRRLRGAGRYQRGTTCARLALDIRDRLGEARPGGRRRGGRHRRQARRRGRHDRRGARPRPARRGRSSRSPPRRSAARAAAGTTSPRAAAATPAGWPTPSPPSAPLVVAGGR